MKQKSSLPLDLLEAALISLLALALTLLPHGIVEFSAPLGIALVIFLPGYAIVLALFPRASDLAMKERMLLCLAASAIVAVLTALCLSFLGRIIPSTFAQALAVISQALIAIAYIRWSALPSGWRFIPSFGGDMLPAGRRQSIKNQIYVVLLSLAVVIIISAFAYSSHTNNNASANTITIMSAAAPVENGEKKFTEFYILDESSQASIEAGSRSTIIAGVINREHRTVDYTLRLIINSSVLSEKSIKLNHNKSWEGPLSYTIGSPVNMQRLDLLLYKDGDLQKPYDERNIWINVSGQAVEQINNKSKSEVKPKDLPQNTVVKLQHDGDSAGVAINSQNTKASSIEEIKPEVEEAQPPDTIFDTNLTVPEQKELQQTATSENLSDENLALNFSSDIKAMNASDIDQEAYESNGTTGSLEGQENNNGSLDSNLNNDSNRGSNTSSGSFNVDQLETPEQSGNNLSANKSITNPYSAVQKFYTRSRPGSATTTPKVPALSETAPASNTSKPEAKSGFDSNGVYRIQSAVTSGTDKSNNIVSRQTNKNTNALNSTNNESANKSVNTPKSVSPKPKTPAPQDEEAVRMAEMSKKIDSWVSTRGMSPSNSSGSYKSDIIQFNRANNSVVLGGQSAKTKKLG